MEIETTTQNVTENTTKESFKYSGKNVNVVLDFGDNKTEKVLVPVERLKMSKTFGDMLDDLLEGNSEIPFDLKDYVKSFMKTYEERFPNNELNIDKLALSLKNYFCKIFVNNDSYCDFHLNNPNQECLDLDKEKNDKNIMCDFDRNFIDFLRPTADTQQRILFGNFVDWLNMEQLLQLFMKMISQEIDKYDGVQDVQKIRDYLGEINDFTPEEEEELKKELEILIAHSS